MEEEEPDQVNSKHREVKVKRSRSKIKNGGHLSQLPCDVFVINNKHVLQKMETFNELSEHVVNSASQGNDNSGSHILQKLIKVPVHDAEHFITFGQYLRHLYEHDLFMDVSIKVKGEIFHAHSVALCCNSQYFAALFAKHTQRKIPFEINIKGIHPAAFAAILDFFYTGEINATPETAADILIAADFLKVPALKQRYDYIARSLPLSESLKVVLQSKKNNSSKLHQTVLTNVLKDFKKASMQEGFLDMDVDFFCVLIQSDELEVASEYDVFTIAVQWIVHRLEERVRHTMRVMSHVRFVYMTQLELLMCAETTSLIRGYEKFREMILMANWQITADQMGRAEPFKSERPYPRHSYLRKSRNHHLKSQNHQSYAKSDLKSQIHQTNAKSDLKSHNHQSNAKSDLKSHNHQSNAKSDLMSQNHQSNAKSDLKSHNHQSNAKSEMPPPVMTTTPIKKMMSPALSDVRWGHEEHFDILVVGGFDGNSQTHQDKSVEKYLIYENQWLHFSGLPSPRRHQAVVTIGNSLYLIGGSEPYTENQLPVATNTVHVMDLDTKKWSKVSSMNVCRYSHCACVVNGKIFVAGGKGKKGRKESVLVSMECYDPQNKGWIFAPSLPEPMFAASAASIENRIYVVGGIGSDKNVLCSVYSFNTTTSSWSTLNKLRIPRCHSSLVNVNGTLFLCGGATCDVKNSMLRSVAAVDEYNSIEDEWEHAAELMTPRRNAVVAVAGDRIYMIGGISTTEDRALQSIECYDTRTSQWVSGIQDLPYPAKWIVGCAILSEMPP